MTLYVVLPGPVTVSPGPVAPPSRVVADESVKISTLWGVPESWLVKSIVNGVLARAARQFVSKAMFLAVTLTVVPDGLHAAVGGGIEGWCRVGVGWARARPPVADVAIFRFRLCESNHATTRVLPSPDTAMLGLAPACETGSACAANFPPEFVPNMI